MAKKIKKIGSAFLLCALVFSLSSLSVRADVPIRESRIASYSLDTVPTRTLYSYSQGRVYLNSKNLGTIGRVINGEIYIPIRKFAESNVSGVAVRYDSSARTLTISGSGHNISVSDGAYALYADGRVLFSATPSRIMSDGRMYVPAKLLSEAFGLSLRYSNGAAYLSGTPSPILSGDKYYRRDEVYWLARIISAESRGEPLIGQIAVGNVVLNRVRSREFPNTIYGVIFDRKNGVQFSPVLNGSIYNEPTATSLLAAKICLDGFTVDNGVTYFLRPSASTSSWIVNNRPFLFVIGNHYFFA